MRDLGGNLATWLHRFRLPLFRPPTRQARCMDFFQISAIDNASWRHLTSRYIETLGESCRVFATPHFCVCDGLASRLCPSCM